MEGLKGGSRLKDMRRFQIEKMKSDSKDAASLRYSLDSFSDLRAKWRWHDVARQMAIGRWSRYC